MIAEHGLTDLLYSFGTQPPGLVTLHNFPRFLQEFTRPDGRVMDLGAVDILRTRELGVPRYNEFRRLHAPRAVHDLRGARRRAGVGPRDRRGLRRGHREGRPQRRAVRRAAAPGVRLQRHRLPGLRADGVPPAQQRPVLHRLLHPGGLHPGGPGLDRRQLDGQRAAAPPPGAAPGDERRRQRLRRLAPDAATETGDRTDRARPTARWSSSTTARSRPTSCPTSSTSATCSSDRASRRCRRSSSAGPPTASCCARRAARAPGTPWRP